jgi:hypothetical protein
LVSTALDQGLNIVPLVELGELGKTGGAHPHLEGLPLLEVGQILRRVTGELLSPVGRGDNLRGIQAGLPVQVAVRGPGDVRVVLHLVDLGRVAVVDAGGRSEGIVKHGVGNQTARVDGQVRLIVPVHGVALRAADGAVADGIALELAGEEGLHVAAVVLVEVGEVVVEEDWRAHVFGNDEFELADVRLVLDTKVVGDVDVGEPPPLGLDVLVAALEGR